MSAKLEELEKIIGGKLERSNARTVPGIDDSATKKTIYFSDDGKNKFPKQFKNITCFTDPPNAVSGGVNEGGCKVTPPNGPAFYAAEYHGDLEGWKKDIEEGAKGLGLLLAKIENEIFLISDGRNFPITECEINFY